MTVNDDQHEVTHRGSFITVLVVIAFLAIVRLRIASVPLERDEGEYAYAGHNSFSRVFRPTGCCTT